MIWMNQLSKLLGCFALCSILAGPVAAGQFDHRNSSGRQLLLRTESIEAVSSRHGLTVLDSVVFSDGILYLVEGPDHKSAQAMVQALGRDTQVRQVEKVVAAVLPAQASAAGPPEEAALELARTGSYATACHARYLNNAWAGYADQQAARTVGLADAHQASRDCGAGVTVAVIDTGVDETHPLLEGAVLPGLDLFDPTGIGSEWSSLEHSVRAIVEHSVRAIVEQSSLPVMAGEGQAVAGGAAAPVVGPEAVAELQQTGPLPPYFGHGTMVAGLVRLVAPGAKILPIRAFAGDGSANLYDVARAIRWAADQDVQVINMSFSLAEAPLELAQAIRYAESRGALMVAAVGNQGNHQRNYPAALSEVLGAAAQSTEASGSLAAFSNWGSQVADIAAPGSALVTAFPGGLYAVGWGTSFSAPLVAGAAALLFEKPVSSGCTEREIRSELMLGTLRRSALNGLVVSGQLDVKRAAEVAGD